MQQELVNKAKIFKDELYKEWKDKGIVNNTDPQAFDSFFAEKSRDFRDKHKLDGYDSADVATAFIPNVEAARSNLFERHINERMELMSSENQRLLGDNTVSAIENAYEASGDFDVEALGVDLTNVSKDLVAKGMNGSKVNEILINTITQQAEDLEDDDILQVLSQIETATGTLADTAYAKQKIDEAETNILSKEIRKANWLHTTLEWDKQEYRENAANGFALKLSENNYDITKVDVNDYIAEMKITDQKTISLLQSFSTQLTTAKNNIDEDEEYVMEILNDFQDNINDPELIQKIINGIGAEKYTAARGIQLLNDLDRRKKLNQDHMFFKDGQFVKMKSDLKAIITKDSFLLEHQLSGTYAVEALDDFALQWIEDNPQGKKIDFIKALRAERNEIVTAYAGTDEVSFATEFQKKIKGDNVITTEETSENQNEENPFTPKTTEEENKKKTEKENALQLKETKRVELNEEYKAINLELAEVQSEIDKIEKRKSKNETAKKALLAPLLQKKTQLTSELQDVKSQLDKIK